MDMAYGEGCTMILISESGEILRQKGMVFIHGRMEIGTKGNGSSA
jgi:hypothetical protein